MVADGRSENQSRPLPAAGTTDQEQVPRSGEVADAGAFAELFRRYCDEVYADCLDRLSSPAKAADLTEVVFTRLWQRALGARRSDRGATLSRTAVLTLVAEICGEQSRPSDGSGSAPERGPSASRRLPGREQMLQQILYSEAIPPTRRSRLPVAIAGVAVAAVLAVAAGIALSGGPGGRHVEVSRPAAGGPAIAPPDTSNGSPAHPMATSSGQPVGSVDDPVPVGTAVRVGSAEVAVLNARRQADSYQILVRVCRHHGAADHRAPLRATRDQWRVRVGGSAMHRSPMVPTSDAFPALARLGDGDCTSGWIAFTRVHRSGPIMINFDGARGQRVGWRG